MAFFENVGLANLFLMEVVPSKSAQFIHPLYQLES